MGWGGGVSSSAMLLDFWGALRGSHMDDGEPCLVSAPLLDIL